jgi:hypothetical protein
VKVNDANDGVMYNVYLHLACIDPDITTGATVRQRQIIGTVGDDEAHYPHLHMEFRKGTPREIGSVHPLGYLPYVDSANFTAPVGDRFNRIDGAMAARLLFSTENRLEGDLKRIEVDLKRGSELLTQRVVDFNDKGTVNEGNDDKFLYVNSIGVEGYQKSNLAGDKRSDLRYGILVRKIPSKCDALVARVIDIGGNVSEGGPIEIPDRAAVDEFVDFEDGAMPPAGWTKITSASGSGTTISNSDSDAHFGARCMLCVDDSKLEASTQRACIQYVLPPGRFEWRVEGWFNPTQLELASGESVYLLYFLDDTRLSVAARIRNHEGELRAGLLAKNSDGKFRGDGSAQIATGVWRKWRLVLLRIGTRETTAILYLNEGERMVETARVNWDSTLHEPNTLRAGIGFSSTGAEATVLADELWLTESEQT